MNFGEEVKGSRIRAIAAVKGVGREGSDRRITAIAQIGRPARPVRQLQTCPIEIAYNFFN